jgi:hypothetical protein
MRAPMVAAFFDFADTDYFMTNSSRNSYMQIAPGNGFRTSETKGPNPHSLVAILQSFATEKNVILASKSPSPCAGHV